MQEAWDSGGQNPGDYYLEYPFQAQVEKKADLPQLELQPDLNRECYEEKLRTYFPEKRKLAYFLYKLFPILFSEKNQLLIVLDQQYHKEQEWAVIAREVTWLASMLAPGDGVQAGEYRKRLSYGVYVHKNAKNVNLVYSDNENLNTERFYLDCSIDEQVTWPKV